MKIKVEYFFQLKEIATKNDTYFTIQNDVTVKDFICENICANKGLADVILDDDGKIKDVLFIAINDEQAGEDFILSKDATITLMFPIAGG